MPFPPRLERWLLGVFLIVALCVLASGVEGQEDSGINEGRSRGVVRPDPVPEVVLRHPSAGTGGEKPATSIRSVQHPQQYSGARQPPPPARARAGTQRNRAVAPGRNRAAVDLRTVTVGDGGERPAPVRVTTAHVRAALVLSRICKLEAEGSLSDCTALYHIGRKRFGDDWLAGLLRYSKLYERSTPRARRIAAAPDGDIPGASRRENERWRALRAHAVELVAGKHPDPCPRAMAWGGTMDVPHAQHVPAKCAAQGHTANILYRVRGKR